MRKEVKPLIAMIDKKLASNGLAQQAIANRDPRTLVWLAATALVGIKEATGKNDGYEVGLIQSVVGGADKWPWCFIGETQILTEDGWQRFDRLDKKSKVAQVSECGNISFVKPTAHIKKEYDGAGYNIKSQLLNLTCDEGHRFWGKFNNNVTPRFDTLDKVTSVLSIENPQKKEGKIKLSDKEIHLLAAFLADGFFKKKRFNIQVSRDKKIKSLRSLNPVGEYKATKVYGKSKAPLTDFVFDIPDFFSKIFDDYKCLKWDFILSFDKKSAQKFISYYAHYDGYVPKSSINSYIISSSRKELADQIQTLALFAGYAASMNVSKSPLSGRDCFIVRINTDKKTKTIRKRNITKVKLKEPVYCVTVPHERIIVRGGDVGTSLMVGNCASFIMACIMYAEVKTGRKSPVAVTEHAQTIWNSTPKSMRVKSIPLPGAIIVWGYKDSKGKLTVKGHTEIVIGADNKVIRCVGGNTSGTTSPNQAVNREGNGAFYTVRDYKSTAKKQYLGCVKSF